MDLVHPPTVLTVTIGATLTLLDLWLCWRARSKPDRHLRLIRSESPIRHRRNAKERAHLSEWARLTGLDTWRQMALLGYANRDSCNPDPPAAA